MRRISALWETTSELARPLFFRDSSSAQAAFWRRMPRAWIFHRISLDRPTAESRVVFPLADLLHRQPKILMINNVSCLHELYHINSRRDDLGSLLVGCIFKVRKGARWLGKYTYCNQLIQPYLQVMKLSIIIIVIHSLLQVRLGILAQCKRWESTLSNLEVCLIA